MEGKDYCIYRFKNGSYFDNVVARESSRGKRRHGQPTERTAAYIIRKTAELSEKAKVKKLCQLEPKVKQSLVRGNA